MLKIELVAIAKNEGFYIAEWLAYHLALGFDKITVFNNESSDRTTEILELASAVYPIETISWPTVEGKATQRTAYNYFLEKHRDLDGLVGFIDIDEFVMSRDGSNPVEIFRVLGSDPTVGAVCLNQRVFGDSGQLAFGPGPVLKRLPLCAALDYPEAFWVKSFYRLACVERIQIHSSRLRSGRHVHPDGSEVIFAEDQPLSKVVHTDFSSIQLNHYITKTFGEFLEKQKRGDGCVTSEAARFARYTDSFFYNRQPFINAVRCEHTANAANRIEECLAEFWLKIGSGKRVL